MKDFDLEEDLLNTDWIVEKCKFSANYCSKLYSALCNTSWQKTDLFSMLKYEPWQCSWRYAGGIIAKILNKGDYLDWYCGGNEGYVDEEIKRDLEKIGWVCIPPSDNIEDYI